MITLACVQVVFLLFQFYLSIKFMHCVKADSFIDLSLNNKAGLIETEEEKEANKKTRKDKFGSTFANIDCTENEISLKDIDNDNGLWKN